MKNRRSSLAAKNSRSRYFGFRLIVGGALAAALVLLLFAAALVSPKPAIAQTEPTFTIGFETAEGYTAGQRLIGQPASQPPAWVGDQSTTEPQLFTVQASAGNPNNAARANSAFLNFKRVEYTPSPASLGLSSNAAAIYRIGFDVRLDAVNTATSDVWSFQPVRYGASSSPNIPVEFRITARGEFRFRNGANTLVRNLRAVNQWNRVDAELNFTTNTYKITINNEQISVGGLPHLSFGSFISPATNTADNYGAFRIQTVLAQSSSASYIPISLDNMTFAASATAPPCTPDFGLSTAPGTQTRTPGATTAFRITATTFCTTDPVNFSASNLPAGATATFSPASIAATGGATTATIKTAPATPVGSYPITITATSGAGSRSLNVTLNVVGAAAIGGTTVINADRIVRRRPFGIGGTNILSHSDNNFATDNFGIPFRADATAAKLPLIRVQAYPDNRAPFPPITFFDGKVQAIVNAGSRPLLINYIDPALNYYDADGNLGTGGTPASNVVFLVKRYTAAPYNFDRVYIEIGNEPDLTIDYQATPEYYAQTFNAAHDALVAAGLREKVVLMGPGIAFGYRQPWFFNETVGAPGYNADFARRNRIMEFFLANCNAAVDVVTYHTYSNENTTNPTPGYDVLNHPKHLDNKENAARTVTPNDLSDANSNTSDRGLAALLVKMNQYTFARDAGIGVTEHNTGGTGTVHTIEQGLWNLAYTQFMLKNATARRGLISNSFVFDTFGANKDGFGHYNEAKQKDSTYWALWTRGNLGGSDIVETQTTGDANEYGNPLLLVLATRDAASVTLEVINRGTVDITQNIQINGAPVRSVSSVRRLAANATPDISESAQLGNNFSFVFPATSATIIRLPVRFPTAVPLPVTVASANGAQGANDWYVGAVTIDFIVVNSGAGDARSEYSFDNGASFTRGANLALAADGVYNILYRSVDAANNAESPRSLAVKIDRTAPTLTVAAKTPRFNLNGKTRRLIVSGRIGDQTSGAADAVEYTIADRFGAVQTSGTAAVGADGAYNFAVELPAGRGKNLYTITARGADAAGNQATATARVVVF